MAIRLSFGVFPLGMAGTASGVARGAPDDPVKIEAALRMLQGEGKPLLPRTYVVYTGPGSVDTVLNQIATYVATGISWDMVLCFRDPGTDLTSWLDLVRTIVQRHGTALACLSVTAEANLTTVPAVDGAQPSARQALVSGIQAAHAVKAADDTVAIGFCVVPSFGPNADFWPDLQARGGPGWGETLDYVGLDFYPDVFGPRLSIDQLRPAVTAVLRAFRDRDLPAAGIPASVPIHIAENGWPTGPDRPYDQQAAVLETVICTVAELAEELNITHYELFGLRDADSSNDNFFFQFGIMRDDYAPKPAFAVYQRLIQEFGERDK